MTDLRNLTILGMIGRLNMLIDEGNVLPTPSDVKQHIAGGAILDRLKELYGDFPEFSPIHTAEKALMLMELKTAMERYQGREASKMGIDRNGLCLLVGYCVEMMVQRNIRELRR